MLVWIFSDFVGFLLFVSALGLFLFVVGFAIGSQLVSRERRQMPVSYLGEKGEIVYDQFHLCGLQRKKHWLFFKLYQRLMCCGALQGCQFGAAVRSRRKVKR